MLVCPSASKPLQIALAGGTPRRKAAGGAPKARLFLRAKMMDAEAIMGGALSGRAFLLFFRRGIWVGK